MNELKAYLRGLSIDDMNRLIGWLAVEVDMSPDLEALVTEFRAANDSPNQLPPCEGGDQCPADDGGSRKMSRAGATEDAEALALLPDPPPGFVKASMVQLKKPSRTKIHDILWFDGREWDQGTIGWHGVGNGPWAVRVGSPIALANGIGKEVAS